MIGEEERLLKLIERQEDMLGIAGLGRANTAALHVSPDGNNADGLSWRTAYQALPTALDACSTDANDLTLLLMAPGTYDINQPGQPTWAANVVIQGSHRHFVNITNTHATASCVLRLEGLAVVQDVCFTHIAADNGLILTEDGFRVYRCLFDGTALTGAGISLFLSADNTPGTGGKVLDCDFIGNVTNTIAIKVDTFADCNLERLRIHECERGIWIQGSTTADHNLFSFLDIGECVLGIDIDQGDEQFFHEVVFHHNTRDIDDEEKNHIWVNIHGQFPIYILPDNFVGITVTTGAPDAYGGDTQLVAAAAIDNPFRVVGTHFEPSANEWYKVRFTGDSGAVYYDEIQFDGNKREGAAAPSGTEFIFNAGSRISCSAKSESGGNNTKVWIEIQEL